MPKTSPFAKAAQRHDPTCPAGHPLTIVDEESLLFGICTDCDDTWRVTNTGKIIPKGHPLG